MTDDRLTRQLLADGFVPPQPGGPPVWKHPDGRFRIPDIHDAPAPEPGMARSYAHLAGMVTVWLLMGLLLLALLGGLAWLVAWAWGWVL